jgi:hypothetical protein
MPDNFDRFGNKARGERMQLEKQRQRALAHTKRKNKPRGEPAGATISGHAPHDLVEQLEAVRIASGGDSRSHIVVAAVRAGLPAVRKQYAKKAGRHA